MLSKFEATWQHALPIERRQLIRLIIKRIVVHPDQELEIDDCIFGRGENRCGIFAYLQWVLRD